MITPLITCLWKRTIFQACIHHLFPDKSGLIMAWSDWSKSASEFLMRRKRYLGAWHEALIAGQNSNENPKRVAWTYFPAKKELDEATHTGLHSALEILDCVNDNFENLNEHQSRLPLALSPQASKLFHGGYSKNQVFMNNPRDVHDLRNVSHVATCVWSSLRFWKFQSTLLRAEWSVLLPHLV